MVGPVGVRVTEVTEPAFTVTVQAAEKPRSAVMAVTVAVPAATAVTIPVPETVAMVELLLDQIMVRTVAVDGATVATRGDVLPMFKERVVMLRATPVTGTPVFPP